MILFVAKDTNYGEEEEEGRGGEGGGGEEEEEEKVQNKIDA